MGGKQLGFSDYELMTAKKQTKREKFLAEMEEAVPWATLIALIEPHYPKASKKGGRPGPIKGPSQAAFPPVPGSVTFRKRTSTALHALASETPTAKSKAHSCSVSAGCSVANEV